MFVASDLVLHHFDVVFEVKVTLGAVGMLGILFLVFDHRLTGFEVREALLVGALDFAVPHVGEMRLLLKQ
jgi:hypothetical protein